MASTVIYQKRGDQAVKVAETPDLSPYAIKADVDAELVEKANIDGYYYNMTVGNAEQLISDDYVTNQMPYAFRTAGGSADIGNREYDKIIGGTLAWNQLRPNSGFTANGASEVSYENNIFTWKVASIGQYCGRGISNVCVKGHKYLYRCKLNVPHATTARFMTSPDGYVSQEITTTGSFVSIAKVIENGGNSRAIFVYLDVRDNDWAVDDTFQIKNWCVFDLTQMFGSAIADHIYALETTNTGDGVAWFTRLFTKPFYQYNAGTLMSVNTSSHDMVGFNALNITNLEQVATNQVSTISNVPVVGGQQYEFCLQAETGLGNIFIDEYDDASGSYIKRNRTYASTTYPTYFSATLLPETTSVKLTIYHSTAVSLSDVKAALPCFHLVWSGYRNGEYEEYEKHSYALDSSLELRGVPMLDDANNMYYNGDTYETTGSVKRRYGIVDLGTLTWTKSTHSTFEYYFTASLSGAAQKGSRKIANIVCSKYAADSSFWENTADKGVALNAAGNSPKVYIVDTSYNASTEEEFKAAMSGVYLVYERISSTIESATPFQSLQIVSDFGTEQYIDYAESQGTRDVAIPVGHDTKYIANLVDKLRRLPDAPDAAGKYLVHYDATTRRMSCTEYLDGAKVTALEGKVPDAPTTDGTYVLTATVTDETATYSWEAQA